jgi:hypothetical protein
VIGNTGSVALVEILLDSFLVTPFKFWLAIESIQQTTEPIFGHRTIVDQTGFTFSPNDRHFISDF